MSICHYFTHLFANFLYICCRDCYYYRSMQSANLTATLHLPYETISQPNVILAAKMFFFIPFPGLAWIEFYILAPLKCHKIYYLLSQFYANCELIIKFAQAITLNLPTIRITSHTHDDKTVYFLGGSDQSSKHSVR